jgi:hypothetical protein
VESFPFDLKPLISSNHLYTSFDTLKSAIEYLANQQNKMNDRINIIDRQSQLMADMGMTTPASGGKTPVNE